ncbi:MAG: DMT family transporter [Marinovum sp.]|nr:DMT family transporter [Marinovum sp.]
MISWAISRYSDRSLSIIIFLAAAVWGLYWVPIRGLEQLGVMGPWSIAYFNACPLLVLVPALFIWRRSLHVNFGPAVFAGVILGIGLALYATGLVATSVVRATLLFYLTPIWSTIIGMIWLSERVTALRILAILCGLLGCFLLLRTDQGFNGSINIGDLCSLMSGVFWAVGAASLKRWPGSPTLTITSVQLMVTTLVGLGLGLALFEYPTPDLDSLKAGFALAFFTSVFVLLPSVLLIFIISQILFPGRVGILMMSEVLVAIISASILLPDEQMALLQWLGAAAIILSAFAEVSFSAESGTDPAA